MLRPRRTLIAERGPGVRSGPNIPEAQRHTVRVRISSLAFQLATQRAERNAITVAQVIEALLIAATTDGAK